jgi:hypothetical protein
MSVSDVVIPVAAAAVSGVVGWSLSELSHKAHRKSEAETELKVQHRQEQLKVLVDLQTTLLEYYEAFSKYLWSSWSLRKRPKDRELNAAADESFESVERLTMRLFALHSRCDDFKVQGVIDYLEEMARNFMTEPGTESYGPSETRESQDIVFRHDRWFERSIIIFNSRIGDRILKLTGSSNAEARFFGDAPDEDAWPWYAPIEDLEDKKARIQSGKTEG